MSKRISLFRYEDESTEKTITKILGRFVFISIVFSFNFSIPFWYNTLAFTAKSGLSVISGIKGEKIFNCDSDEYIEDASTHLAYVIKDFVIKLFFSGSFFILYAIAPSVFRLVDDVSNRVISWYCSKKIYEIPDSNVSEIESVIPGSPEY
jgi:hypothetical protein